MNYKTSLFIFRRDLRLQDNTGLIEAIKQSETVIPCFIFDSRQVSENNHYRSLNAIQFMIESLQELDEELRKKDGKLYLFYGKNEEIIGSLLKAGTIDAVFCNRDYTPFSIKRDEAIKKACLHYNVAFNQYADALLHEPEEIKTQGGTPYAVFTAFYKASLHVTIREAQKLPASDFYRGAVRGSETAAIYNQILPTRNKEIFVHGGRKEALSILKSISDFQHYQKTRDFPALHTTALSAHLKFGTVSVREVYEAIDKQLGHGHPLSRQLYWRDFFTHVAYHSPFVYGHAFHKKYDHLDWNTSKKDFDAWCAGKTGFPIVDAGMRQLNATGYMHNRVRMIVASFLTKDLHINWLWGEKYFARQLVDYDPAVNNGNWQWSASTGCDAQPYFRIFNPWLQQAKFDPECVYIKTWIPELKKVAIKDIHMWDKKFASYAVNYPAPMVDHSKESAKAKLLYKSVKS
ncbi:MAG TPA: deoxyribodipyrimidine photo-lyase [Candidatus Babeliales bacterium]|nr:deoxyribodipyrimidine photo-lyase [Candidatus Babeliales bacterium]